MTPLPDFGAPDHSIRRLFQIGMRAQNSEQPRLARTAYAEILRQNPRLAEIYFHLARLELAEGHSNAALKHLTTARTLKPGEPEIWALTVDALKARNKPAALRKLLNEARTAGLPQSTIERLVYRAQSDGKSGVAQLGKIPPRAFQACVAQYRGGQLDFALQMAEQLAAQYPPAAPLETLIASIHTAKGEVDAAIRRFERAVSLDPNYAEARIMLGQVFLGTGQRDRAKQEFTAALRGVPNSPVANRFLGEINIAENQLINARRQLEIAMALALRPKAFLLDEPMAGMGPEGSARLTRFLNDLRQEAPILLVEHDMDAVFALADRISVLVYGKVIATGAVDEIRNHPEVRTAYLGEET